MSTVKMTWIGCDVGICPWNWPIMDLRHLHVPCTQFPRHRWKPNSAEKSLWVRIIQ